MNITERFFVTGTDIEVGKTVASSALLQAANQLGLNTTGYKPVASGSDPTVQGLRNEDTLALQCNNRVALSYGQVSPYTFTEPISPHIISADEGRPIAATTLSSGLRELECLTDWVLMEGVGGWFTPLSGILTLTDWAQREQLPMILVMGTKLGCINHAILTAQAVRQAGLPSASRTVNDVQPPNKHHGEYLATLKNQLAAPFFGEIPQLVDIAQRDGLGQYLDLNALNLASSTALAAVHSVP